MYRCLDADADGFVDGAELTQPIGCFRGCLQKAEVNGKLAGLSDEADVTDVMRAWLMAGENSAKTFRNMLLSSDLDCLEGADGPCDGCER